MTPSSILRTEAWVRPQTGGSGSAFGFIVSLDLAFPYLWESRTTGYPHIGF